MPVVLMFIHQFCLISFHFLLLTTDGINSLFFPGTVTVTEIETVTGTVNVENVTVNVSVTGSVIEIVTAIVTVTAKKNVGNTEAGHAKKTVTENATVTGERD